MIVNPLVRDDAADEQEIDQAIAEDLFERGPPGRIGDALRVDGNRHHTGWRKSHLLELLPVELGVAKRQIRRARRAS